MNNVRIERMLRELHNEPPLRFFEDLFALKDLVAKRIAELRQSRKAEEAREGLRAPGFARSANVR